jgi:CAAX protease family protein
MTAIGLERKNPVTARVRALGHGTETAIVLGTVIGIFTLISFVNLHQRNGSAEIPIESGSLYGTLILELILALLLVPFLWARGWRLSDCTDKPAGPDVVRGLGVWLLGYIGYVLAWIVLGLLRPEVMTGLRQMHFAGAVSWPAIAIVTLINPIFEEFLFLGYTVPALSRFGLGTAGFASVAMRALVHVYQGPLALVAIAPVGVVFLYSYLARRSLWPAVVAHMIFDAMGLVWLAHAGGAA